MCNPEISPGVQNPMMQLSSWVLPSLSSPWQSETPRAPNFLVFWPNCWCYLPFSVTASVEGQTQHTLSQCLGTTAPLVEEEGCSHPALVPVGYHHHHCHFYHQRTDISRAPTGKAKENGDVSPHPQSIRSFPFPPELVPPELSAYVTALFWGIELLSMIRIYTKGKKCETH